MITSYRQQTEHQHTLSRFDLVIANSDAVGEQFARAGLPSKTLYPALVSVPGVPRTGFLADERRSLAFVGRFEDYKGGSHLLKALPQAAMQLGMPVHLTMVGDGSQRGAWEQEAIEASARHAGVSVEFTGWLSEDGVSDLLQRSDLLVVPSVWPEPFGLVGLEAAQFGLPSAAFGVGGIPEWLTDGVSGHLADGRRCAPEDLSAAIVRCISDSDDYCQLSRGAVERRTAFSPEAHLQRLEEILRATASAQSG